MNKVYHINLGGYPFTIDDDAYDRLTSYMASLESHFARSADCSEIMGDIEIRMAELMNERLSEGKRIVNLTDIEAAIHIMGSPEDFETDDEAVGSGGQESEYYTGKRLFRDPDNNVIGGVSSGIAAYFGIQDPVWIRLAFVLLTISGGMGVPAYIILWIVMPEAKTSADRLHMRGAPINISNIARVVEEGVENIASKIDNWDKKDKSRKKKVPTQRQNGRIIKDEILVKRPIPSGMFL